MHTLEAGTNQLPALLHELTGVGALHKLLAILFILFTLFALPCFALDAAEGEKILYFDSNIVVNKDVSIDVSENISVYAPQNKILHGIVRRLPLSYTDGYGISHQTSYHINQVLLNNQTSDYHIQHSQDQYSIDIGSSNLSLTPGIYTFTIQYHVDDAINFLKDEDELSWNITGNDWDFPIIKVEGSIQLPGRTHILNYAGYTGAKDRKEQFFYIREESDSQISFVTTQPLKPGDGLTINVSWPKGVVQQSARLQQLESSVGRGKYILFGIILVAFVFYFIVRKKR